MAAVIPKLQQTLPSARTQPAAPRGLPNISFPNLPSAPRLSYHAPKTAQINAAERDRNLKYQEMTMRFEQQGREAIVNALGSLANNMARWQDQKERQKLTRANTELQLFGMELDASYQDRKDYENFESDYVEKYTAQIDQMADQLGTPAMREQFSAQAKLHMKKGQLDIRKLARGVEVDVENAGMMQRIGQITDAAVGNGDLETALTLMDTEVEAAWWMSETDKVDFKKKQTGNILQASLEAVEENPAEQLKRLNTLGESGKELLGENTFNEMVESAQHGVKLAGVTNQVTKWEQEGIPYENQLLDAMEISDEELRDATVKEIEFRKQKRDNADTEWRADQYDEIALRLRGRHPELPAMRVNQIAPSIWQGLTEKQRSSLEALDEKMYPSPDGETRTFLNQKAAAGVENQLEELQREYHATGNRALLGQMRVIRQENEDVLIRANANDGWRKQITNLMKPDEAKPEDVALFTTQQKMGQVAKAMGLDDEDRGVLGKEIETWVELQTYLNNGKPPQQDQINQRIDDLVVTNYAGIDSFVFENDEGELTEARFNMIMAQDAGKMKFVTDYYASKGKTLTTEAEKVQAFIEYERDRRARGYAE